MIKNEEVASALKSLCVLLFFLGLPFQLAFQVIMSSDIPPIIAKTEFLTYTVFSLALLIISSVYTWVLNIEYINKTLLNISIAYSIPFLLIWTWLFIPELKSVKDIHLLITFALGFLTNASVLISSFLRKKFLGSSTPD